MTKQQFQTSILASSTVGAALLAIVGLGFSAPNGEMSKLAYDKDLWCVSNYIEEEDPQGNKVTLPDPDGRNKMDPRYKDKEDWFRREQVTAQSLEEAEKKATKPGFFERSDKTELRAALDKSDEKFVTHHFNTGATHPGPCVGTGGQVQGLWINDAMRKECFNIEPPGVVPSPADDVSDNSSSASTDGICIGGKGVPENWAKIFAAAGKKYKINPAWLAAPFAAENGVASGNGSNVQVSPASRWPSLNRSWSTSSAGAAGPMQIMPNTWPSCRADGDGDGKMDVQNIYDAIYSAARLVRGRTSNMSAKNPTSDMMRRSAITYNCGPGCLKYRTLPAETTAYIYKTREAFKRYNCP